MELLLFVSSNCSHCPKAKYVVERVVPEYYEYGLSYTKIRTKTNFGRDLSFKYHIMGVPVLLFLDKEQNEVKRIVGVPSENRLRNDIEKMLGLKKSFLSRIFGAKNEPK